MHAMFYGKPRSIEREQKDRHFYLGISKPALTACTRMHPHTLTHHTNRTPPLQLPHQCLLRGPQFPPHQPIPTLPQGKADHLEYMFIRQLVATTCSAPAHQVSQVNLHQRREEGGAGGASKATHVLRNSNRSKQWRPGYKPNLLLNSTKSADCQGTYNLGVDGPELVSCHPCQLQFTDISSALNHNCLRTNLTPFLSWFCFCYIPPGLLQSVHCYPSCPGDWPHLRQFNVRDVLGGVAVVI
jgi:hypothetical protein